MSRAWEKDLLERKEVAEFLKNTLEDDPHLKVVNIDSPWGTGKSFFLDNWCQELKESRGVVYFNAWEKDYTGDPFVSLVSAIRDQLGGQRRSTEKFKETVEDFTEKASSAVLSTVPIFLKLIAKGGMRKLLGIDTDSAGKEITAALEGAAEASIKAMIENSRHDEKSVEEFKEVFSKLVKEVASCKSNGGGNAPVYVLIDELDRCRPTYAIELLERVKHFFSIEGCKFIIATDTKQLIHSIKAVYGVGFDSKEYLNRFFDLDYTFETNGYDAWVKTNFIMAQSERYHFSNVETQWVSNGVYFKKSSLRGYSRERVNWERPSVGTILSQESFKLDLFQIFFLALSITFKTTLRGMERNKRHFLSSLSNIHSESAHVFYLMYMIFLKNADESLYENFIDVSSDQREVNKQLDSAFPPRYLYFPSGSKSVHDLALKYIKINNYSNDKLQDVIESGDASELEYELALMRKNNLKSLDYHKVVALASRIK